MTITEIIPLQYRFLAAVLTVAALMLASAAGGAWVSGALWAADLAEAKQAHAQALAAIEHRQTQAQAQARSEEQRRQTALEGIRTDASEQIEQAQADAAAADATADGLLLELDRLKRRTAICASAATGGAPAQDSTTVLADLLSEVESAGRAMAAEADRRGIAGTACERSYDAVKGGG